MTVRTGTRGQAHGDEGRELRRKGQMLLAASKELLLKAASGPALCPHNFKVIDGKWKCSVCDKGPLDLVSPAPPTKCPHSDGNSCEQYRLQGQRCQDCPVPRSDAELREIVAKAICKSRTCEGINCCEWPANMGRRNQVNCPVRRGAYDDAANDALAALKRVQEGK